ncbi:MAG: SH3 domain-containing protein [Alphaproteobacteria bacterium]|jgi:SH3-like domain-containing protein|nr:SH3 domain-containing protein [Alphaproteobacteria bacterium]
MRFLPLILTLFWMAPPLAAETGLPLPRFVSLGAEEVNLRTGPGLRYPVAWVFVREDMPVEIVAEFEQWRRVRDFEGAEGWVHKAMLSGTRTVLVLGDGRPLRARPDPASRVLARAEARVQGRLHSCRSVWCEVTLHSYRGWMQRTYLWGVYPEE